LAIPLDSFGRVLADNLALRRLVRLLHMSVVAKRNLTAYQKIQMALEQTAGRINGAYRTFEWQTASPQV